MARVRVWFAWLVARNKVAVLPKIILKMIFIFVTFASFEHGPAMENLRPLEVG